MNAIAIPPLAAATRARAIILVCACAALASGALSALGDAPMVVMCLVASFFFVAAWILPLNWVALALAALIPFQIYFPIAGGLNLRGALVFVAAAALRVLIVQLARLDQPSALSGQRLVLNEVEGSSVLGRRSLPWLIPAALFIAAALVAALTAPNRYSALKGVYDWLPIFAAAFVVGEIVRSERLVKQIVGVLIVAGASQAGLGLAQAALDVPRVVGGLQWPISALFYQPSLLRDRLSDLSFNWILFDRVLPFGTFINGIDYAIFLAAVLSLVLAILFDVRPPTVDRRLHSAIRNSQFAIRLSCAVALLMCVALLGSALLQTFKGSGMIALAGGVGAIALWSVRRVSPRALALSAMVLIVALILAAPFFDDIARRALFLIQREVGAVTASGRTAIWAQLLAYLPQRPWFGWGLNNTGLLVQPLPSLSGGTFVFNIPTAESAYVGALVETGLIGFAALMWFIGVVLTRAFRVASRSPVATGIGAAIVAILFGSLTVVGLTTDQNGILLGVLIGLIFSSANRANLR